jgi:hypothetical protein
MEKIPTADEFLNKEYYHIVLDSKDTWVNVGDIQRAMVEFAKLHVEAALKEASEDVELETYGNFGNSVNKDSILNSYPLTNIK